MLPPLLYRFWLIALLTPALFFLRQISLTWTSHFLPAGMDDSKPHLLCFWDPAWRFCRRLWIAQALAFRHHWDSLPGPQTFDRFRRVDSLVVLSFYHVLSSGEEVHLVLSFILTWGPDGSSAAVAVQIFIWLCDASAGFDRSGFALVDTKFGPTEFSHVSTGPWTLGLLFALQIPSVLWCLVASDWFSASWTRVLSTCSGSCSSWCSVILTKSCMTRLGAFCLGLCKTRSVFASAEFYLRGCSAFGVRPGLLWKHFLFVCNWSRIVRNFGVAKKPCKARNFATSPGFCKIGVTHTAS